MYTHGFKVISHIDDELFTNLSHSDAFVCPEFLLHVQYSFTKISECKVCIAIRDFAKCDY